MGGGVAWEVMLHGRWCCMGGDVAWEVMLHGR